jgi:hypothetical protein
VQRGATRTYGLCADAHSTDWATLRELLSAARKHVESSDGADEKRAMVLQSTQKYMVRCSLPYAVAAIAPPKCYAPS